MVLEDFCHTSKFGPFESHAGEMVAYIGSDSDSKCVITSFVTLCPPLCVDYRVEFGGTPCEEQDATGLAA